MKCPRCGFEVNEDWMFCPYCAKKITAPTATKIITKRRRRGQGTVYRMSDYKRRQRPYAAVKDRVMIGLYATKEEAQAALDKVNATGAQVSKIGMSVEDVYNAYKAGQRYAKLTSEGINGMNTAWNRVGKLAHRRAIDVTISDYQHIIISASLRP